MLRFAPPLSANVPGSSVEHARTPFPEYSEYLHYIATEDVRSAFRYLVEAAGHLESFEGRPAPHGHIKRNYHYFEDGLSPFAFTVNRRSLLFYLRKPAQTHPTLAADDLRKCFSDVKVLPRGQVTFRMQTGPEARMAMDVIFADAQASSAINYLDEVVSAQPLLEGATKSLLVNSYERNPAARRACITEYGFRCTVCELSFAEVYGALGEHFIHVHHLVREDGHRQSGSRPSAHRALT